MKVEFCVQHRLPLIMAGDTFDTKTPSSFDVDWLGRTLEPMFAAGLDVFAIQGQHDFQTPPWTQTATLRRVKHVNRKLFTPVPGLVCMGFDAMKAQAAEACITEIPPECNCVIMHQLCRQVFDKPGSWDFDVTTLPPNVLTALIGDYHVDTDVLIPRDGAPDVHLVYPGSGHICSITEPWQKYLTVVTVVGSGLVELEKIPMPSRRFFRVILKSREDLDKAVQWAELVDCTQKDLPPELQTGVVHVIYPQGLMDVESRMRAALADKAILWPELYGSVAALESREQEPPTSEVKLEECLARFVTPGSDVFEFTREILETMAPGMVFESWRRKMGLVQEVTS